MPNIITEWLMRKMKTNGGSEFILHRRVFKPAIVTNESYQITGTESAGLKCPLAQVKNSHQ